MSINSVPAKKATIDAAGRVVSPLSLHMYSPGNMAFPRTRWYRLRPPTPVGRSRQCRAHPTGVVPANPEHEDGLPARPGCQLNTETDGWEPVRFKTDHARKPEQVLIRALVGHDHNLSNKGSLHRWVRNRNAHLISMQINQFVRSLVHFIKECLLVGFIVKANRAGCER